MTINNNKVIYKNLPLIISSTLFQPNFLKIISHIAKWSELSNAKANIINVVICIYESLIMCWTQKIFENIVMTCESLRTVFWLYMNIYPTPDAYTWQNSCLHYEFIRIYLSIFQLNFRESRNPLNTKFMLS